MLIDPMNNRPATKALSVVQMNLADIVINDGLRYRSINPAHKLDRPELFRLLAECRPGDVLLVEQVDRLSRLNGADWERLKAEIAAKRVRVVALDLPTSHQLMQTGGDDFAARMLDAINGMMLDMLAAIARKDYEDRRRRQAQGIVKAKAEGVYRGRPEDMKRNEAITAMLRAGQSWSSIVAATGCSRSTLSRLAKRIEKV